MEKITIVVPCYNYAKYLPECIDSIKKQTYQNIEIIVVNDGSPDNTEEICKELDVTCLTKPNGGLSSARNYGIKHANGKYIMCLDADDILPKWSIESHMELSGNKKIVQCALKEFGDFNDVYLPQGATIKTIWLRNTIYCNAVFPKKAWEQVGGYDESEIMRLGYEDWEFWLRLLGAGYKLVTSNKLGLLYRVHQTSMTRTTTIKNKELLIQYIRRKNYNLIQKYI